MTPFCGSAGVVTIFDHGAGNLYSLAKALESSGARVRIDDDPLRAADRDVSNVFVLPGVGAFTIASERLARARDAIRQAIGDGLPVIGICLGMQLLFASSEEGPGAGLGVIGGRVRRLRAQRVPQMGWNTLQPATGSGLPNEALAGRPRLDVAYYANSFVCEPDDHGVVSAWSCYEGDRFPAAIRGGPFGNVVGVQFHPEKSSTAGVRYLQTLVAGALAARDR